MSQPNEFVERKNEQVQDRGKFRTFRTQKNPMEIDLLVENVLGFLNVEDIKNCRFVSSQWGRIGKSVLQKRSRVLFDTKTGHTVQFLERFGASMTRGKFTSFRFERCIDGWSTEALDRFFYEHRRRMRELQVHFKDALLQNGKTICHYNVSHWIKHSQITKLSLDTGLSCHISLSLHHLPGLKELHLKSGNVNLREGFRVRLKKLDITDVYFFQNGRRLTEIHIDDPIDFTDATDVRIISHRHHRNNVNISYKDFVNVNTLNLEGVGHINWQTSRCTINSLTISHTQNAIVEHTDMNIKELTVKSGFVNLHCLPNSVEKLTLHPDDASFFSTHQIPTVILPNLKSLHIQVDKIRTFGYIPYLFLCLINSPNIVNFSAGGAACECELYFIPDSVQNVKSTGPVLRNINCMRKQYQKLVFEQVDFEYATQMLLNGMNTNILVLECLGDIYSNMGDRVIAILNLRNFIVFIGRFNWNPDPHVFELNDLRKAGFINTMGEYYMFVNGKGWPITKEQFNAQKEIKA